MLLLEGYRDLPQAPAVVWSQLSDTRSLAQCIPGVESVTQTSPDRLECTLRPGFAFVRGTLELTLEVTEKVPATFLRFRLHTKGIGSSSEVEATVALSARGTGTWLHWRVEIKSLGGLLKMVPPGLIQGGAERVLAEAFTSLEKRLSESNQ